MCLHKGYHGGVEIVDGSMQRIRTMVVENEPLQLPNRENIRWAPKSPIATEELLASSCGQGHDDRYEHNHDVSYGHVAYFGFETTL